MARFIRNLKYIIRLMLCSSINLLELRMFSPFYIYSIWGNWQVLNVASIYVKIWVKSSNKLTIDHFSLWLYVTCDQIWILIMCFQFKVSFSEKLINFKICSLIGKLSIQRKVKTVCENRVHGLLYHYLRLWHYDTLPIFRL